MCRQVKVPGFLAEEVRPYKKLRNRGHRERVDTVRKLQQAADEAQPEDGQLQACTPLIPPVLASYRHFQRLIQLRDIIIAIKQHISM